MLTLVNFVPFLELCNALGKNPLELNLDLGFIANGGDSLRAATLATAYKCHGLSITIQTILVVQTLRQLLSNVTKNQSTDSPVQHTDILSFQGADGPLDRGASFPFSPVCLKDGPNHSTLNVCVSCSARIHLDITPSLSGSDSVASTSSDAYPLRALPGTATPSEPIGNEALTEMQLHFIHGTLRDPHKNVITHSETYYSEDIPVMKLAWQAVIESEPIFSQNIFRGYVEGQDTPVFSWVESDIHEAVQHSDILNTPTYATSSFGAFFTVTPLNAKIDGRPVSKITWRVHHSLVDGYSAVLLLRKVLRLANGLDARPGPAFSVFLQNFRRYQESNQEIADRFWIKNANRLCTAKGNFMFPSTGELQTEIRSTRSMVKIDISTMHLRIDEVARELGVTRTAFFNAAWAISAGVYCDSDVIAFGTVCGGRTLPIPGVDEVVGPLVNTLPLVVRLDGPTSTKDLVLSVFRNLVALESFQWKSTQDMGLTTLIESALTVQFSLPSFQGFKTCPLSRETSQDSDFPLRIDVHGEGLIQFQYHEHRFTRDNVSRMALTFTNALEALLQGDKTVRSVIYGLRTEAGSSAILENSNCSITTMHSSIEEDLVTLFERQARKNPAGVALEKGSYSLTYEELDRDAGKVAQRLSHYIKPGEVVCVHSDRSFNWLIAVFGILKAGGVYCSLDQDMPAQLRSTVFSLSGARYFLVPDESQLPVTRESCPLAFSVSRTIAASTEPGICWQHRVRALPASPAYVCFTSGSTGIPKGVVCRHESLVAFQSTLEVRLFAEPGRRIAQLMSVAFDGSIHEIFSALTYGATLVLPSGPDPFAHLKIVDSAILTPSLARVLNPLDFAKLKWAYFVGEPVPQAVCDQWAAHKQLYNMYGPTEGTCGATIKRLFPARRVTIGRPNPTTRVYILTSLGAPAPLGIIGEIYLAGIQIADGYIALPEQTQERFLHDSIWATGERMYKTGDRGYWDENGEIVCLGRVDRQIKLRGYRVDLNDLEIRIADAYPLLDAVAVAQRGDSLVAMVQPMSLDVDELQSCLSSVLPHYAMPQVFIPVFELPMTSAGKIDYKKVSQAEPYGRLTSITVPRTKSEKMVEEAFRSILKLDDDAEISLASSFLELGGHSLSQLQLLQRLSRDFGTKVSLQNIVERPTIRDLAEFLDAHPAVPKAARLCPPIGEAPATPIENEWLQKYSSDIGSSSFNVCFSCTFDIEKVDRGRLVLAWERVLSRHKLLSCKYQTDRHGIARRVQTKCPPRVQCVRNVDLWKEVNRPFDILKSNPCRVFVTDNRLLLVLSHIVADYTALALLLREASLIYNEVEELDKAPRSYAEATVWYKLPAEKSLQYWSKTLGGLPRPSLLGRHVDRANYGGTSALSWIDGSILNRCLDYTKTVCVTMQQLAIASVAACLDTNLTRTDMVVGVPYINREAIEDVTTFGLFLEPLPVRITFEEAQSLAANNTKDSYIQSVRSSSQAALSNAIPWHQLLAHLGIKADYPNHPLFDIMVTVHDWRRSPAAVTSPLEMVAPGFDQPSFVWSGGAKFKLLCEFTILEQGELVMRLEYDPDCVTTEIIRTIQAKIPRALALLASDTRHSDIKNQLSMVDPNKESSDWAQIDPALVFGKPLNDMAACIGTKSLSRK
ncbi:nonribosomal peptide synthase GliP-like protein [Xylaria acuta]|nr:nonribosomal peptide synthase GliP-like protein [Xylaria acuta]